MKTIVAISAIVGAFAAGFYVNGARWETRYKDLQLSNSRIDAYIRDTADAARKATAEEISKIKVVNTTINRKVEREVKENTVYADCRLPDSGLRIANEALAGQLSGVDKLPGNATATGK